MQAPSVKLTEPRASSVSMVGVYSTINRTKIKCFRIVLGFMNGSPCLLGQSIIGFISCSLISASDVSITMAMLLTKVLKLYSTPLSRKKVLFYKKTKQNHSLLNYLFPEPSTRSQCGTSSKWTLSEDSLSNYFFQDQEWPLEDSLNHLSN